MQMIDGENLGHYVNMGFNYVMNDRNYTNIRRWENDVMEYALELTTILSNFHQRHKSKIYPKYNKQYFIHRMEGSRCNSGQGTDSEYKAIQILYNYDCNYFSDDAS